MDGYVDCAEREHEEEVEKRSRTGNGGGRRPWVSSTWDQRSLETSSSPALPFYYDWPSLDVDLPIPSPLAPPFDFLISRRGKPDLQRNISKLSAR